MMFPNEPVSMVAEKRKSSVLNAERIASTDRTKKLETLQKLKEKEAYLKDQLQKYADKGDHGQLADFIRRENLTNHVISDPVLLQQLYDNVLENRGKANIWTSALGLFFLESVASVRR